MLENYDTEVQTLFLQMMLTNPELYTRVSNIMNPENFDSSLRPVAEMFKEHTEKYKVLPDSNLIRATTKLTIEPLPDMDSRHDDFFLDEFETFTKRKELERAIVKSIALLDKGEFGPVEKMIKDAVQISLQKDMGLDYFANPRERLLALKSDNNQMSTGWKSLDYVLYGGFDRGTLNILCGGSGSGKSVVKMNLATNWLAMGLNGAFITLELSEGLCAKRLDSMISDVPNKDIFARLDDVELKLKMKAKTFGHCTIKYMPAQSSVNDIRAYCKELEVKTGRKIDFLCVDYLDLVMPSGVKVSAENVFIKDKFVSEELRNLAKELNVLFVTSSQLNRGAADEIEFDHSHIAGGLSKIMTADNVFAIYTSRSMRERGKYQLQLLKTRNSGGVGTKIDLDFNPETLRIFDSSDGSEHQSVRQAPAPSGNDIMSRIKTASKIVEPVEELSPIKKVKADVKGSQLRALLGELKGN